MSILATRFARLSGYANGSEPLTEQQLRRAAPSVFAESAHESRSERYTCIPTIEVIRGLGREGFMPFMACQARTRDESKTGHAKHMLRFRHASRLAGADEANEIILINSHDGSTSYQMLAGVFRFVCQNGLVVGNVIDDIRVRHSGNIIDNVIEGAYTVLSGFEVVDDSKGELKQTVLSAPEKAAFAAAALPLKYDDDAAPIDASRLLSPHRAADTQDSSLWTTLNVVQENLIRGGQMGRSASGKRASTREVRGIDGNVRINRGLWILAEEMRKLKAA